MSFTTLAQAIGFPFALMTFGGMLAIPALVVLSIVRDRRNRRRSNVTLPPLAWPGVCQTQTNTRRTAPQQPVKRSPAGGDLTRLPANRSGCYFPGHQWFGTRVIHGCRHVIPLNDYRIHRASPECWCKPERAPDMQDVLVHNAMDEREFYETGQRRLA